jgi:molecular chaperone GrpE (heat shock protein)
VGDGIFWWTLTQLLRNARRLLASPTPQEARQTKDAEIALLKEQRDRARRQRIEADAEIARLRNALRKIESDTIDHVAVALARKALAALDTPSSPSLPESPVDG